MLAGLSKGVGMVLAGFLDGCEGYDRTEENIKLARSNHFYRKIKRFLPFYAYFCSRIEVNLSETYRNKKKRYAYLVIGNVGNFQ